MSSYNHLEQEGKWQRRWKEWKLYHFDPSSDAPVYSIDTPPRYTSGALHFGHATSYPLMDFAARYRRMKGYNVLFPLCFDGNGMPVETATEKKYGIDKFSVDRKTYLRLCEEYASQFIERMTEQFEMLGMSMDPSIYYETHAPYFRKFTQISFLRLLSKGLAYRGKFHVNWCPHCNTSLADAEVEREEIPSELHYIRFELEEGGKITVATTRPEMIAACKAVIFHPSDSRYRGMSGRKAILPIYGKAVEMMEDGGVDTEFGSGAVMVCSYGDREDADWIMKHRLPVTVIIDEFGRMNEEAGFLRGLTVQEARRRILQELSKSGNLVRSESIRHSVGVCWRCSTPVEIIEKMQWFLKTVQFRESVLEAAERINWYPPFMKQRLIDWVNSLSWDWVISRQRVFATPVPVWECVKCDYVLPASEEQCYLDPQEIEAPSRCPNDSTPLQGSRDVFDTWMDSSITALYNSFWLRDDRLFKKLFPMSMRGQAHEIIRTWAYYTIIRSLLLENSIPWRDIMITAFIMAPDGTPMHTHLGNVIDPAPLIEKYGADALRYYAATCSPGADQAFREKDVIHGQRLCNKLWNIASFVSATGASDMQGSLNPVDEWAISLYNSMVSDVTGCMERYEFERAMRLLEQFTWHVFADDYIEMVKKDVREGRAGSSWTLRKIADGLVRLFAPFMPHVTEAIYQELLRGSIRSIHVATWPEKVKATVEHAQTGKLAADLVNAVRTWRAEKRFTGTIAQLIIASPDSMLGSCASCIACASRASEVRFERDASFERRILSIVPNFRYIGPRYRERASRIVDILRSFVNQNMDFDSEGNLVTHDPSLPVIEKEAFTLNTGYFFEGMSAEAITVGETLIIIRRK